MRAIAPWLKLPALGLSVIMTGVVRGEPAKPPPGMVFVPGGSYQPLYSRAAKPRTVKPFFMDITQVTNAQFLAFVKAHPEWSRSKVTRARADAGYLQQWAGDLDLGPDAEKLRDAPVTNVSWYAAKAYCEAEGRRLPTQDEWEFAACADATRPNASGDPAFLRQLLDWYAAPAPRIAAPVQTAPVNYYGLRGLHGLVWEWVNDFNSTLIVGDSRGDGSPERNLFCGAGSLLAADVGNYAAFMRYAFRASLKGSYCVGGLGFRAAKSVNDGPRPAAKAKTFATLYELPGVWRTQDDKAVTLASLRGKVRVLTMGFTRCRSSCPRILADMQRIEQALGPDADRAGFVFLSIDPEYDTPAQMTKTLAEHRMNSARWTFLSAPEDIVQQAAVALDFKYQNLDGIFAHSNLIVVLDEEGRAVHREETLDADLLPAIKAIRKQLARH